MEQTVIVHISSGRGPVECERAVVLVSAWLSSQLMALERASQVKSAPGARLAVRTVEETAGVLAVTRCHVALGISTADAQLKKTLDAWLAAYGGTVQWICPSPYRPGHRRKNWFIQVSMDEASPQEESHDRIPPDEVRFETARSSGKGGQHVNKTETAVRVVHIPTGLVAIARDERSQWHNKKLALARLGALLQSRQRQAAAASKAEIRSRHDRLERGNAVAVFIGRDFRQAAD